MPRLKITPIGDRILVQHTEDKEQVRGGVIIPDNAKEKPQEARVIALGNGPEGAGIAGLLLTTECMITEIPDASHALASQPHGGGMDY